MSKPRYGWWPYVKSMVRRYPALKEAQDELLKQKTTAIYSWVRGAPTVGRPVERSATRSMGKTMQKEFEAVRGAVEALKGMPDGDRRIGLIDLVYWRKSHTLQGAAIKFHISFATAKRWHVDFINLVARNYGLFD